MKTAQIIAVAAGILAGVANAVYVNSQHLGVVLYANLIRASLVSIILGVVVFFVTLAIGRFIYELTKHA